VQLWAHQAVQICVSINRSQATAYTARHGASASRGVSVYFPAEAGPHFTDPGGWKAELTEILCYLTHSQQLYAQGWLAPCLLTAVKQANRQSVKIRTFIRLTPVGPSIGLRVRLRLKTSHKLRPLTFQHARQRNSQVHCVREKSEPQTILDFKNVKPQRVLTRLCTCTGF